MCSDIAVQAINLSKCYQIYDKPQDRLKQTLWRGRKQYYQNFFALQDVSFELKRGEVMGIVGLNGAGKSTLLQMICGTLTPSSGQVNLNGRISALLELGSGFHHDFTGRENVYMNATILGLSTEEIDTRFDSIARFADIGDFINQPVKVYSSGMLMRLAFAVAVNVDPDILIIDEALSVGDGAFSHKSFDKIMSLKDAGKTILFCSHSAYQVESLSNRVLWLDHGAVRMFGDPEKVIMAYTDFYQSQLEDATSSPDADQPPAIVSGSSARITKVTASADGVAGKALTLHSGRSTLTIEVTFKSNKEIPTPSIAVAFKGGGQRIIASSATFADGLHLIRDEKNGGCTAVVTYPEVPLLRGDYGIDVYLMCEKGVLVYDIALRAADFQVVQNSSELGVVSLQHAWHQPEKMEP